MGREIMKNLEVTTPHDFRAITYYKTDGSFVTKEALTEDNLDGVHGMMVRCTMKNGDVNEGFADSYGVYDKTKYNGTIHDFIYLWTWDNLDEETHRLVGDMDTKFQQTYVPVKIRGIQSVDAILYSNPRWGGRLYNHFFIDISDNDMFWFSELLTKEFIDYFKSEESVYFTVTTQGKEYHKTFKKFKDTIDHLFLLLIANDFDDEHYNKHKEMSPDLYKLSKGFFKEKRNLNYQEIYHSIKGNVFECDIASLNADQLAVGLMFPFVSRMGGSSEDSFAESGRLREFILALYDKASS